MVRRGLLYTIRSASRALFARPACWSIALVALVSVAGCDTEDMPVKPSASLNVAPVSTSTSLEQIAIRVELSLRVDLGLAVLADAVTQRTARVDVCVGDECASEEIESRRDDAGCGTAVGGSRVEIASAWLDQDVVGVEFCVPTQTTAAAYETTIMADDASSNPITTSCGISGAFLECASE